MTRILSLAVVVALSTTAFAQNDFKARFEALDDKGDTAGIVKLWKEAPGRVLGTIDSYLEGSLGMIEKGKPDMEEIKKMHARALSGALAADEAFGRPIFSDYASSFIGWTSDQQKDFRAGQKAFGASRKAARDGKLEEALAQATKCYDLAQPLGDWWGTAMGLSGMGNALEKLGKLEEALAAHSGARLIYHDLGLGSELSNLVAMSRILVQLERTPRARVTIEKGLVLARKSRRGKAAVDELEKLKASLK